MELGQACIPDWREPAAYASLGAADRTVLAWEWLRRNPAYRAAALDGMADGAGGDAQAWGLHRFENPGLAAPLARPLWTAQALDAVLAAEAVAVSAAPAFDLGRIAYLLTTHFDFGRALLLFSDGLRTIRLDLSNCDVCPRAAAWRFALTGPPFGAQLLALRQFDGLVRRRRFVDALHPHEPRMTRHIRVLRAADALAAGAAQRDIAGVLLDRAALRAAWRDERPDLRLQAQRLVRDARARLSGGHRAFLGRAP
jgi:hypothetical protein